MTWIVVAVVAIGAFFFLKSSSKKSVTTPVPTRSPIAPPSTEDSRRNLETLVAQNQLRVRAMSDAELQEFVGSLRQEAEVQWDHAYSTGIGDGKDATFSTQLALFRTAAVLLTGDQQPDRALYGGLDLETVPFKAMPADLAKAGFVEYCVAKYAPTAADWDLLNRSLLSFGDKVFEDSKSQAKPDQYVYEMIYRETLDWQKFLAKAISDRIKQDS
jgi:hypothetical protein